MSMKKIKKLKRQNYILTQRLKYKTVRLKFFKKMSDTQIECIQEKDKIIADYTNNRFRISVVDRSYKELYDKTKTELDNLRNRNLIRRIFNL